MPQEPSHEGLPGSGEIRGNEDPGLTGDFGALVFPDDEDWVPPPEPLDPEVVGRCPDPDSDPPDGEDAWLADLTSAELDALAREAAAARPRVREAIGAGFTHRQEAALAEAGAGWEPGPADIRQAGPAMGFAAGAPLDAAPPGPVLAGLAQDVLDGDLAGVTDDELVGLLGAARRMTSWQAAAELRIAAELDARRRRDAADVAVSPVVSEHVAAELAAALTLTGPAADTLLGLARELTRIRPVLAALAAGTIDVPKARVFADELSSLDDPAATQIALRHLDRAPGWTTSELRRALRAAVLAHDPAAARRRAQKARADTRVEAWHEGSGNAALAGRELPPAETIAADQRISQIARALKTSGATGTMDQLRAAVYLALLLGTDPAALLGGEPASPDDMIPAPGDTIPAPAGSVHLTLPALTWLGLADRPGDLAGLGPLDATTSRHLAEMLARTGSSWHVTLTDPAGRAVAHSCARSQPPESAGPSRTGSSRTGPSQTTGPPDSTGPPGPRIDWLAALKFDWLERGSCQHPRQTSAYQPGKALRHLLAIRNPTCVYPGCRRPARQCDNEHTIPFDAGGRTCECNCAPVCRRHHRVKQAPGWRLTQDNPGVCTWTAPSGRNYVTQPGGYPI